MPPRPKSANPFYLAMSLFMLALVTYGFSRTVGASFLQSNRQHRFLILLGIHGAVFYGWMLFFVLQCALVRMHNIRLHRLLGWFGVADGAMVVLMGLWATFAESAPFQLECLGLVSMAGFAIPFALAIVWRRRPAYHRRLLMVSTAILVNAAFARFPGGYLPDHFFYAGSDLLIAAGMALDLWAEHRIHVVYRYAMPLLVAAEIAVLIPAWKYLA